MFDFRHPYFKPLWIRLVTLAILFGWGLFEFYTAAPFWGIFFCALGGAALFQFFLRPEEDETEDDKG